MIQIDIIAGCWAVFILYWAISAGRVKKDIRKSGRWWIAVGSRLLLALVVILLVRTTITRRLIEPVVRSYALSSSPIRIAGIVLCAAGVALAIWARAHLGANWSQSPSVKVDHELVTSGPYRRVRHPIYSGMLLGTAGTALVIGIPGVLILIVLAGVFARRIRIEEKLMNGLFPDRYPEYRNRTGALIPRRMRGRDLSGKEKR
jgi:protein-S-isoprenylcysteine O-methyltransferase Ste14